MTQLIPFVSTPAPRNLFSRNRIYRLCSRARAPSMRASSDGNARGIEGGFFQVLEGDDAVVDDLYGRIKSDPRHSKITLIIREPIAVRDFSEWTMGFRTVDSREAGQLIGENDFFKSASCVTQLDSGRAKKLLGAFRTGSWRHQRTGTHRALGS